MKPVIFNDKDYATICVKGPPTKAQTQTPRRQASLEGMNETEARVKLALAQDAQGKKFCPVLKEMCRRDCASLFAGKIFVRRWDHDNYENWDINPPCCMNFNVVGMSPDIQERILTSREHKIEIDERQEKAATMSMSPFPPFNKTETFYK